MLAISDELSALEAMTYVELKEAWRCAFRTRPPARVSRDLLKLGVAWKWQAKLHGGLRAPMRRRLANLAERLEASAELPKERPRLKAGMTLLRVWHGRTHKVEVQEDGFAWNGRRWQSLSAIARAITGARWSGPRFFGLTDPKTCKGPADGRES